MKSTIVPVLATLWIAGCAVGPDFEVPPEKMEASFKHAGFTEPPAAGSWWSMFGDAELARLMKAADENNPGGRAALARYDQARAALGLSAADAFPAITGDAYARRQGDSSNSNFSAGTYNDYRAALNLSWEIDLWGRVRRQIGVAAAQAQAARYDYQGAILSLRGEVARAYVSLRFTEAEIGLLEETATLREKASGLMKSRFEGGASSRIDYERSVTEHQSVLAELEQLRSQRTKYENALAYLTGRNASGFQLASTGRVPRIPGPVAAVPSELLRRRPDLAAAERRLAAASEGIGLTIASYLPRLTLNGSTGVRSLNSSDLFNSGSKLWTLGPELSVPIFQGGQLLSDRKRAEAVYREALEQYRDTLLTAVREAEDSLADAHHLAKAASARSTGARSADKAAELTRKRYERGITDYFEVVDAERTALAEKRAALSVDLARALAATRLIQALGGGWQR
ncbi:efflux transporter outer membrane subunit [Haloferula sargassicola]|uniref:efflux transporter outer membrane subunit n=1 Tax=Haloferula sargassicola TaxID=490096 RepID=UPI0033659F72